MTNTTLEFLQKRRSAKAVLLTTPGPTPAELETILTCAARVPDHKKLVPWRFIVFEGGAHRFRRGAGARRRWGREGAAIAGPPEAERNRLTRAPLSSASLARRPPRHT